MCLQCGTLTARRVIQDFLIQHNPLLGNLYTEMAPDGDAKIDQLDFRQIVLPQCEQCGGVLKPNVVFFDENVPHERVQACFEGLEQADALLVVGSSLMIYSGLRFVRRAHQQGIPIAAINRGITRADDIIGIKIEQDIVCALDAVVTSLTVA